MRHGRAGRMRRAPAAPLRRHFRLFESLEPQEGHGAVRRGAGRVPFRTPDGGRGFRWVSAGLRAEPVPKGSDPGAEPVPEEVGGCCGASSHSGIGVLDGVCQAFEVFIWGK